MNSLQNMRPVAVAFFVLSFVVFALFFACVSTFRSLVFSHDTILLFHQAISHCTQEKKEREGIYDTRSGLIFEIERERERERERKREREREKEK